LFCNESLHAFPLVRRIQRKHGRGTLVSMVYCACCDEQNAILDQGEHEERKGLAEIEIEIRHGGKRSLCSMQRVVPGAGSGCANIL